MKLERVKTLLLLGLLLIVVAIRALSQGLVTAPRVPPVQPLPTANPGAILQMDPAGSGFWIAGPAGGGGSSSVILPIGTPATNNYGPGFDHFGTNGISLSTNVVTVQCALPLDWNGGPVSIGIRALSVGTNSIFATNAIFSVGACAMANGASVTNLPNFSTVWVTNHVGTAAFVENEAISPPLTIANASPSASLFWQIARQSGAEVNGCTNDPVDVAEIRIYFNRSAPTNFPAATP